MPRRLAVLLLTGALLVALAPAVRANSPAATRDPCLTGSWQVRGADALALLQQLAPSPLLRVPVGTITASFRRGQMAYGSPYFILKQQLGDVELSATATWINERSYRTRGGRLVLGAGTSTVDIPKYTGVKEGREVTVPGPGQSTTALPAGSVRYTCTRGTLRWPVPVGPSGSTMVTFRRA